MFLSLLVDLLGFTVILPLIPSMLEYYSSHDESGLYNYLLSKVDGFRVFIGAPDTDRFNLVLFGGLLGSLFSLLQFLASPVIGAASDVVGRKPMLLLSLVGILTSYALWAVSYSFGVFVIARVLAGVSKGNVSLSTAIVTDVTSVKGRSKGMALVGAAFSLGFLFGPSIGAAFSVWGKGEGPSTFLTYQYPAVFALSLALLNLLLVIVFYKESLPIKQRASSLGGGLGGALYLVNPISLFKFDAVTEISTQDRSNLRRLGIVYFLYIFLFSGLEYSLTFLVHQRFNYTSMDQGKMFLFIGVVMIAVQGGYLRRQPAGREKYTACMGILAVIPGMLLIGWSSSAKVLYCGLILYSFGSGTVVPSLTSITSKFGEGTEKGKVLGIIRSIGALGRALGPFVACAVYWHYSACVCYMLGASFLSLPLLLLFLSNTDPSKLKHF